MLSDVSAQTAIYSPQAATAKLALTEFLVTRGWRAFLDAKAETKIAETLSVSRIFIFPVMPPS